LSFADGDQISAQPQMPDEPHAWVWADAVEASVRQRRLQTALTQYRVVSSF
jgi:hypothetical protein